MSSIFFLFGGGSRLSTAFSVRYSTLAVGFFWTHPVLLLGYHAKNKTPPDPLTRCSKPVFGLASQRGVYAKIRS